MLEAIVSLSPRFEKLRNPLLRKIMAPRTTISMAAKLGGCSVEDFFQKLAPLGFEADRNRQPGLSSNPRLPSFFKTLTRENIHELDVRPLIASGRDPLNLIMEKVKTVKTGEALKIINSFEPVPLINMLGKKGFKTWVDKIDDTRIESWFFRSHDQEEERDTNAQQDDWEAIISKYKDNLVTVDVRHLKMPGPMIAILEALDKMPEDKALFVQHKKIPLFLLPELASKKYEFRINEVAEGNVQLVIFRLAR